eukprot:sb/3470562/
MIHRLERSPPDRKILKFGVFDPENDLIRQKFRRNSCELKQEFTESDRERLRVALKVQMSTTSYSGWSLIHTLSISPFLNFLANSVTFALSQLTNMNKFKNGVIDTVWIKDTSRDVPVNKLANDLSAEMSFHETSNFSAKLRTSNFSVSREVEILKPKDQTKVRQCAPQCAPHCAACAPHCRSKLLMRHRNKVGMRHMSHEAS